MKRFSDPYYSVNSLMLLSYCLMRLYFFQVTPEGSKYSRHKSPQDFASWVSDWTMKTGTATGNASRAGHGTKLA